MQHEFLIGDRHIGGGAPCLIIAEAGVNHNGDLAMALKLVDVAADAGADAVKFQTFTADRLATRDAPKAGYQIDATGSDESQHAMLKRLELSAEGHRALKERCEARGILFLSTPFDEFSADLLESLDVAAFKTPSGELTNLPYLKHVAKKRKPMIVSTGMATLAEVANAVDAIRTVGGADLALLQCVSNYPAEPSTINLRAMETLSRAFGVPAGYSDHTMGLEIAFAAAALGACIIEKHFTISRNLAGPDHRASLEPHELQALVRGIRAVEQALGDGRKMPAESERASAAVGRKSLVLAKSIVAGEMITDAHLEIKRPGTGLLPHEREFVLGRTVRLDIDEGTPLRWDMLK